MLGYSTLNLSIHLGVTATLIFYSFISWQDATASFPQLLSESSSHLNVLGTKCTFFIGSSKDSDCWSSSRGPESSKMFTKTSVRPLLYGTWGMSQYWILDIYLLKPLWKTKTNYAFYSVSRRWQFGAREMGILKYFLSSCKVAGTAVQAFELFLYVPVQIWKRC